MEGLVVTGNFWRNKRVFLTGHTGFKGGWLCLWLQSVGARICGYSLEPPTRPNIFQVAGIESGMTSVIGDIRNPQQLHSELNKFQPEIVFHLAAQALVLQSYHDPVTTYDTNVMGTVHLLEAIRKAGSVETVIIVTSDKCYENHEWPWGYRENEAMGGYDPYSSSKGCVELVTSAYRRSFFSQGQTPVNIATVRAGNVIGGGDWAQGRLIPDLIRAFGEGKPALIRNPAATRPWQHVLEPLSGYLQLAQNLSKHPEWSDGWNFGPDWEHAKTVKWVADQICEYWGETAHWKPDQQAQAHEAGILHLDTSKARSVLGWSPKLKLAESLALTTNWYKAYTDNQDMNAYTQRQLDDYRNRETR